MHRVTFVQCLTYRIGTIKADGLKDFALGASLEDALYGITAIVGPIIAWVSSWIMYAFGELVDKTASNERNTQNIS